MNNQIRIKNSRNEYATIWPIGDNPYFYSVKWDYENASGTYCKGLVDDAIRDGEWNIVRESKLPSTFNFVTKVREDTDGNVYTCKVPEDDATNVLVTWKGKYGDRCCNGYYSKIDALEFVENGAWKIIEEPEDEQEPDLMNYLYEIVKMRNEEKEFVPHSFKYYHVEHPETIGTFTAIAPDKGIVTYNDATDTLTYWDSKWAEKHISEGTWVVIPSSEYVKDYDEDANPDIMRIIADFTASSKHFFAIENGKYNVYRRGQDYPFTCENADEIMSAMNAIEVLDSFTGE